MHKESFSDLKIPERYHLPKHNEKSLIRKITEKGVKAALPRGAAKLLLDPDYKPSFDKTSILTVGQIATLIDIATISPQIGATLYVRTKIIEGTSVIIKSYKEKKKQEKEEILRNQPVETKINSIIAIENADPSFIQNASSDEYITVARGLDYFFTAVETNGKPRVILDIGTGTGRAITQFSQDPTYKNLSFMGTALTEQPRLEEARNITKVFITSGEKLEGIPDKSVGGIISFTGIGFSDHPELVVTSIDRVLAEGGVVKATFRKQGSYGRKWNRIYDKWGYHYHNEFSKAFNDLGYTLATLQTPSDDVMLAVKPGGQTYIDPSTLLSLDNICYIDMKRRGKVGHVIK